MIGDTISCEAPGCEVLFVKKTHNQIYHDANCTKLATNMKIMEKYYEKKARRLGQIRYCATCGTTQLSRYNPDAVCNACAQNQEIKRNESVGDMLSSIEWIS